MITVEINNSIGAFVFKQFNTLQQAKDFKQRLETNCNTLKVIIKF